MKENYWFIHILCGPPPLLMFPACVSDCICSRQYYKFVGISVHNLDHSSIR